MVLISVGKVRARESFNSSVSTSGVVASSLITLVAAGLLYFGSGDMLPGIAHAASRHSHDTIQFGNSAVRLGAGVGLLYGLLVARSALMGFRI